MDLKELKQSGRIIFECVAGSQAYGLNIPGKSDIDLRGIYINPIREYLGLIEPSKQISDEKNDTTYYSLKRFFELAQIANPNIIELLWMPEDCIKITSTTMEKLIANRDLFISKKCFHTHSGYAYSQIHRAKGQNKKVHNPQPEERPKKEDFCSAVLQCEPEGLRGGRLPLRPRPLTELQSFDLNDYHVAALEHTTETYRLYYYGDSAKGVFRGDQQDNINLEKYYGMHSQSKLCS